MTQSVSVAVAGDVDHGKSTLLGRLAAELRGAVSDNYALVLDGLVEEREGEYTLDTAQVVVELGGARVTLIDVPGHEELLRNMVTGASRADAAVLVVAADTGFTPQTATHTDVLALLGLTECVVAVSKMDLVDFDEAAFVGRRTEVENRLADWRIGATSVVPTFAVEGDNIVERSWRMPWYEGPTIAEAVAGTSAQARAVEEPRFTVQGRVGDLVLGRVAGGSIRVGQELLVYPARAATIVRQIVRFGEPELESATRGASVAVRLEGHQPARGDVLTPERTSVAATDRLRLWLLNVGAEGLAVPSTGYTFRQPSREVGGRLVATHRRVRSGVDRATDGLATLEPGELGEVTIAVDEPIAAEPFSRGNPYGRLMVCRDGVALAAAVVTQVDV